MKLALVVIALAMASQCSRAPNPPDPGPSPAPTPTPSGGSGPTTPCEQYCAALLAVDCPEGQADNCVSACERVREDDIVDLRVDCVVSAHSQSAVRACGSVRCRQ